MTVYAHMPRPASLALSDIAVSDSSCHNRRYLRHTYGTSPSDSRLWTEQEQWRQRPHTSRHLLGPCCHMYRSWAPPPPPQQQQKPRHASGCCVFYSLDTVPRSMKPAGGAELWPLASGQTKQADTPLLPSGSDHARWTCWALVEWTDDKHWRPIHSHIHGQTMVICVGADHANRPKLIKTYFWKLYMFSCQTVHMLYVDMYTCTYCTYPPTRCHLLHSSFNHAPLYYNIRV